MLFSSTYHFIDQHCDHSPPICYARSNKKKLWFCLFTLLMVFGFSTLSIWCLRIYKFWSAASPSSCRSHDVKDCFKLKMFFFLYLLFIPYNHASEIYCISEIDSFFLYHNMPFSKSMCIYIDCHKSFSLQNLIKCKSIFSPPFFSLFKEVPITNNNFSSFSLLPLELTMLFFLCHDVQTYCVCTWVFN